MNPHLLAHSGPLAGSQVELRSGVTTLGREVGNTIVIADPAVSRSHARITVTSLVATLEDLGSTGGTFVNDARIVAPTILKVGDMIRLGGSAFSYVPAASVSAMGGVTATMPTRAGRRERGSAEHAQPMMPAPLPMNPPGRGCAPNFDQITNDLAGCWPQLAKWLLIMLVVMIVLFVVGGVLMVAGLAGSSAVAGLGGAAGAGGAGSPSGAGGGGGGSGAPPPAAAPDQPTQKQAQGAIEIIEIKTENLARNGSLTPFPYLLLTWRNKGADPVIEFRGDVTYYDSQNHVLGRMKNALLYSGGAVAPEATHKDDPTSEGTQIVFDVPVSGEPPKIDHAKVSPTTVIVMSSSGGDQE